MTFHDKIGVAQRFAIDGMIVRCLVQLFPSFSIVLHYGETIIVDEECAIWNLAHKTHVLVPLTFVFNEFNILAQCDHSIEAG